MLASSEYYLGIMSGTSMDGIDVALVEISAAQKISCIYANCYQLSANLRAKLQRLINSQQHSFYEFGECDVLLGREFAQAALNLLQACQFPAAKITAIGCHGQNVFHAPQHQTPFSLQLGDPNVIAHLTKITTVADFRRRDLADAGQGAPLAPLFHRQVFQDPCFNRVVVNIGGIANLSYLPANFAQQNISGFDCGPGNTLLDHWNLRHQGSSYDRNGIWAATGKTNLSLLKMLLADPFIHQAPPKSTGLEYFNLNWLDQYLEQLNLELSAADIQATLSEFTAQAIAQAIQNNFPDTHEIFICGGGVHNHHLYQRLTLLLSPKAVASTTALGINPDYVEAMMFAWLAYCNIKHQPLNLYSVTGSQSAKILGGVYHR